ncbi:pyruvate, phosphate dikinase [Mycolicibacterium helvum]|uniref:Pyruvate, phosphate dikinase n=1 Tax=Mycolicibacterium helvum TaxID=1534349 RepID=A0A7I7T181_9MYCO|nr:pyruvate, phosphate dikinase [Mycolicibacterium helvum]BBY62690.1 hypothetical protein MHEL_09330 [Mycolicibacterium helvum]
MTITVTTTMPIYRFDHPHEAPPRELGALLGGKGAGLAEMTSVLGLPVPPGFTIAVDMCSEYRRSGWPAQLTPAINAEVAVIGDRVGRSFGANDDPLLVAVRSGAPRSMPGMLDTVLNLGINESNVTGLAAVANDEGFAWDTYRRFLRMFGATVLGAPHQVLGEPGRNGRSVAELRAETKRLQTVIEKETGTAVPAEPEQQLRQAVEAVFRSWDNPRARAYRAREGVDESTGTAVNVQAMVFGNRGTNSGTGVVFTRNPSTGESKPFGDFLPEAQGEDVVSGAARTQDISALEQYDPHAYTELLRHLRRLEEHYRDICDVEFTYEQGRLWILQTRVGKRSAIAAVRAAVAMVTDPHIALTTEEAVARVPADVRARACADLAGSRGTHGSKVATGLAASPGQASGRVVLDANDAALAEDGVILVRAETDPDDVHGMSVAKGILTMRGGLVSHAAVVARGWGVPAVVGAHELSIDGENILGPAGQVLFRAGDTITVDGSTGAVWLGLATEGEPIAAGSVESLLPELAILDAWDSRASKKPAVQLNSAFVPNPVHMESPSNAAWTTAGVAEAVPAVPTPLTWDLFERNGEQAMRRAWHRIGLITKDEVSDRDPFHRLFGVFHGRPAINVDRMRWIADRTPTLGAAGLLRVPAVYLRLPRAMRAAAANQQVWYERTLADLERGRNARAVFLRAERMLESALEWDALGAHGCMIAVQSLTAACRSAGLGGLECEIGSAGARLIEQQLLDELAAVARDEQSLASFLARFGYHGPAAFELSAPSWRERPELLAATLQRRAALPDRGSRDKVNPSHEAVARLLGSASWRHRATAKAAVAMARQLVAPREEGAAMVLQVFDVLRAAARIMGREFVAGGLLAKPADVLLLTSAELLHADPSLLSSIVDVRAGQRARYLAHELPESWIGQPAALPRSGPAQSDAQSTHLKGVAASAGVAQGVVRVVLDPVTDPFEPGEILVCPTADTGWIPYMSCAAAVVVDAGGSMSRGAFIARELGVPCVMDTGAGTKVLSTGDRVSVDGGGGTVIHC